MRLTTLSFYSIRLRFTNVLLDTVLDLTACLPSAREYTRLLAVAEPGGGKRCLCLAAVGEMFWCLIASQALNAEVMGRQFRPKTSHAWPLRSLPEAGPLSGRRSRTGPSRRAAAQ